MSVDDFKSLHNNNYNLKAAELLPTMFDQMDDSNLTADEISFLEEIKAWDFFNEIDENGATIWEFWWRKLINLAWDEMRNDSIALDYPSSYQNDTVTERTIQISSSLTSKAPRRKKMHKNLFSILV